MRLTSVGDAEANGHGPESWGHRARNRWRGIKPKRKERCFFFLLNETCVGLLVGSKWEVGRCVVPVSRLDLQKEFSRREKNWGSCPRGSITYWRERRQAPWTSRLCLPSRGEQRHQLP